jgi:hypothetical protein
METRDRRAAVVEEQRRARQLRAVVDLTTNVLAQGRLTRSEADDLVAATRRRVLDLFPDKEATFDLILAPRFARLIREFVEGEPDRGRVLPFRRAGAG